MSSLSRNQCCECGFISDPDFCPSRIPGPGSRIPDPKTATKEKGEKRLVVLPFFVAANITKLKIILFLNWFRKNLVNLQRIINFLSKTLSFSFSKYRFAIRDPRSWIWDLGSEIRDPKLGIRKKPTPDPGSNRHRIPDPDSGSATLPPTSVHQH